MQCQQQVPLLLILTKQVNSANYSIATKGRLLDKPQWQSLLYKPFAQLIQGKLAKMIPIESSRVNKVFITTQVSILRFIFYFQSTILIQLFHPSNYPQMNLTKSLHTTQTKPKTTSKMNSLMTMKTKTLARTKSKISTKSSKEKNLPSWSTHPSHPFLQLVALIEQRRLSMTTISAKEWV